MTRTEIRKKICTILAGTGTAPIQMAYAEQIIEAMGSSLEIEPEIAEMSATLKGVGIFARHSE